MKSLLRSQKGYTLIVVLLTITLIGIFTVPIISNIMNSTLQYKKSEENLQLEKITDMGVVFVEKAIKMASQNAEKVEVGQYFEQFKENLNNYEWETVLKEDGERFKIVIDENLLSDNKYYIKVHYEIYSSLNREYAEEPSRQGDIIINIEFSESDVIEDGEDDEEEEIPNLPDIPEDVNNPFDLWDLFKEFFNNFYEFFEWLANQRSR